MTDPTTLSHLSTHTLFPLVVSTILAPAAFQLPAAHTPPPPTTTTVPSTDYYTELPPQSRHELRPTTYSHHPTEAGAMSSRRHQLRLVIFHKACYPVSLDSNRDGLPAKTPVGQRGVLES